MPSAGRNKNRNSVEIYFTDSQFLSRYNDPTGTHTSFNPVRIEILDGEPTYYVWSVRNGRACGDRMSEG